MKLCNFNRPRPAMFDNSLDSFIPEWWALETLMLLWETMTIGNVVNRNFSSDLQASGDTVNISRPRKFVGKRKQDADNVTVQDAISDNVAVKLNQHIHTSFMLKDGQLSKSQIDLISTYMKPAAGALATTSDRILLGQVYQFMDNGAGKLAGLTNANGPDYILDTRDIMNRNLAPPSGRYMFHSSQAETQLLKNSAFTSAEKVGDAGTALREASIGQKLGFGHYMCQNSPYITTGIATGAGTVNNSGGYAAGSTTLTVANFASGEVLAGNWITIAGDATPQRVVSVNTAVTTSMVISPGLRSAVVDTAAITVYTSGTINNSGGYAADYDGYITIAGFSSVGLKVGQLVSFGTADTARYTVIETPSLTSILLDRPLESAVSNGAQVNPGPVGGYSFAMLPDAFTWVVRPLALPPQGSGVRAGLASFNGLTLRVTAQYQGLSQGLLITMDFLAGVKLLDVNQGAVMFN